jgi:hypothetical protein
MKIIMLTVTDTEGEPALIPVDNISHIARVGEATRIYLRHVAGARDGILWYVLTREPVRSIMNRLANAAEAME